MYQTKSDCIKLHQNVSDYIRLRQRPFVIFADESVESDRSVAAAARADAPVASFRLPWTGQTALHLIPAFGIIGMNARACLVVHGSTPSSTCLPGTQPLHDLALAPAGSHFASNSKASRIFVVDEGVPGESCRECKH